MDYLKGLPQAVEFLDSLTSELPAISIITYGEIYEGIYFGSAPDVAEQGFSDFLYEFDVISLDEDTMKRFALIRGNLRQAGQAIGDPDILIAATALQHDLTLVSRNARHFERIPGLKLLRGPQSTP